METQAPSPIPRTLTIDLDDEALLTTVGMLFESSLGVGELLDAKFDPDTALNGQLFGTLLRLARTEGGSLRMTDLAAQCRATPSAMTRVSDRLEKLGYAERKSCPSDRRGVFLHITAEGMEAVESEIPRHIDVIRTEILGVLSSAEATEFARLLRVIRDAVHPQATEGT